MAEIILLLVMVLLLSSCAGGNRKTDQERGPAQDESPEYTISTNHIPGR